ncbi:MAG: diacylglycerol kinase family protein, partial [Acidobacteriota bacterium]|nr:diacylglycerol kinase family protein [Acidobacteriota bacterium]
MQIIVNPAAAGGRLGKQWPRLERRLHDLGIRLPTVWTEAPAHATALAATAVRDGHEVVVAPGGGRTISEVLEGLQQARGGPRAIHPHGTRHDAARAGGVPPRVGAAARRRQHRGPRAIHPHGTR